MSANSTTNNPNALYIQGEGFNTFHLVSLDPVAIGTIEPPILQSECAIAVGRYAGFIQQGICAIAIGHHAGEFYQSDVAIALGYDAGSIEQQECAIALGFRAGMSYQNTQAIAIGMYAGSQDQDQSAIAMGSGAAFFEQASQAIAIGFQSGSTNQGFNAVALGTQSGEEYQGTNAIAIGAYAGSVNQHERSIVLNASGTYLNTTANEACYIAPIRNATASNILYYDPTSKEVLYGINNSGGGTAKTFFMDFNSATVPGATSYGFLSNSINANSIQQITTVSATSTPYTNPIPAIIEYPSSFDFSVGSSGDFPTIEAALASPSVTDGSTLFVAAENFIIPNSTGIVISKQVKIYGAGAGYTVLSTNASASAPTYAITVRVNDVTLYGMTIRHLTTNNTSVESAILVKGLGIPSSLIANFVMDSCIVEYIEFGVTILADNFQLSNSTLSYVGPNNSTRRAIGIYRSAGICFVSGITFNNNNSTGNLRAIQLASSSPANTVEIFSGDLVLLNNSQTTGATLSQFFIQENWSGVATNDFSIYAIGNSFNELSAFIALYGVVSNFGNLLNKIVVKNNTFANVPGKGMIAIDGAGSSLTFRDFNNLPIYMSGNSPSQRSWRYDFTPAINSTYNSTGYNNTVFLPVTINQQSDCCIELYSTSEVLMSGYLNTGQWKAVFVASSDDLSTETGFIYTLSCNHEIFYTSPFIPVVSSTPTLYTDQVTLPIVNLNNTNKLLILQVYATVAVDKTLLFYSRNIYNGYLTTPLFAATPLRQTGVYVHPTSISASTTVTQDITFPTPFYSNPIVCCTAMGISAASTNIAYLTVSVLDPLSNKFTIQIRNLNTTSSATRVRINWFAYSEQIY